MTERTVFDRRGGVNAIATVVGRFSDQVVRNPKLNVDSALAAWNKTGKLPGLKFMRPLWLCEVSGGNFHDSGRALGDAHRDLHIISEEFDEVGADIGARSITPRCPERARNEVLAAIVAHKGEVVGSAVPRGRGPFRAGETPAPNDGSVMRRLPARMNIATAT